MRALLPPACAAALLSVAAPAAAIPSWPPALAQDGGGAVAGVTVEAHRNRDIQSRFPSMVDRFIRLGVRDGPHGNLIRWMTPICLRVSGPSRDTNLFVYLRILDVARKAGVAVAPPTCGPANIFVVFSTEPDKALADFESRHPSMLDLDSGPNAKRNLRPAPPPGPPQKIQNAPIGGYGILQTSTTRVEDDMTAEYFSSLVIADPTALEGQSIGLIADHIAERLLATPFRPRGCMPLPSVLDALDPACPDYGAVDEQTAYDEALLRGLYRSDPNLAVEFERNAIRDELLQDSGPPSAGN